MSGEKYYRRGRTYTGTQNSEGKDFNRYFYERGLQSPSRWWHRRRRVDHIYLDSGPGMDEYDRSEKVDGVDRVHIKRTDKKEK